MTILTKFFKYNDSTIKIIRKGHDVWFKAKEVATILGQNNTRRAILRHVHEDNKLNVEAIVGGTKTVPSIKDDPHTIYINESGLYTLISESKLESARYFRRWLTNEVLPMIRKTGFYELVVTATRC